MNQGTQQRSIGTFVFLALAFLPYLGMSVSNSTSISAVSVFSFLVLVSSLNFAIIFRYAFIALIPAATALLASFLTGNAINLAGILIWALNLSILFAAYLLYSSAPRQFVKYLWLNLAFTASFAIVQKLLFLDNGLIPFLDLYKLSGYASVQLNKEAMISTGRSFAQFAEPSMLAAALMIGASVAIALRNKHGEALTSWHFFALGCVLVALLFSYSGASIIGLIILGLQALFCIKSRYLRAAVSVPAILAISISGMTILAQRSSSFNWSWYDRQASVIGPLRQLFSDPEYAISGVGRANSSMMFLSGKVPLEGIQHFHQPNDVYSVLLRIVYENGLAIGSLLIISVVYMFLTAQISRVDKISVAAAWLVAAGITTSYESLALIWIAPLVIRTNNPMHQRHAISREDEKTLN